MQPAPNHTLIGYIIYDALRNCKEKSSNVVRILPTFAAFGSLLSPCSSFGLAQRIPILSSSFFAGQAPGFSQDKEGGMGAQLCEPRPYPFCFASASIKDSRHGGTITSPYNPRAPSPIPPKRRRRSPVRRFSESGRGSVGSARCRRRLHFPL